MGFIKTKNNTVKEQYTSYGDPTERDYIQIRLLPQIQYYSKSSRRMQNEYYALSILNIVLTAAVPIILMLPETVTSAKYISASISAIASIFSSILLIRGTRDNWIEYRTASEALKSELAAFKAKSAVYQKLDCNMRFSLFVERCESIMHAERTGWHSRMKIDSSQTNEVSGTSDGTGS